MAMVTFKVLVGPIEVPTGTVLRLNDEQIRRRFNRLVPEGDDFAAREPLQFKTGELVTADMEIPKVWESEGWVEKAKAPAKKAAKAEQAEGA